MVAWSNRGLVSGTMSDSPFSFGTALNALRRDWEKGRSRPDGSSGLAYRIEVLWGGCIDVRDFRDILSGLAAVVVRSDSESGSMFLRSWWISRP